MQSLCPAAEKPAHLDCSANGHTLIGVHRLAQRDGRAEKLPQQLLHARDTAAAALQHHLCHLTFVHPRVRQGMSLLAWQRRASVATRFGHCCSKPKSEQATTGTAVTGAAKPLGATSNTVQETTCWVRRLYSSALGQASKVPSKVLLRPQSQPHPPPGSGGSPAHTAAHSGCGLPSRKSRCRRGSSPAQWPPAGCWTASFNEQQQAEAGGRRRAARVGRMAKQTACSLGGRVPSQASSKLFDGLPLSSRACHRFIHIWQLGARNPRPAPRARLRS